MVWRQDLTAKDEGGGINPHILVEPPSPYILRPWRTAGK